MTNEKKKPQYRLKKVFDVGTQNKFLSRLFLQTSEFLGMLSLEEEREGEITKRLFSFLDLFLREERWVKEFLNEEIAFFKVASFKDVPITKFTSYEAKCLERLNQKINAFFLNLAIVLNECCKIASPILEKDIKDFDGLSKIVSQMSESKRLNSFKSFKSIAEPLSQKLNYFQKLVLFKLGPQHIFRNTTTGDFYISFSLNDPVMHLSMDKELNESLELVEDLLIYLILLKCPDEIEIKEIDESDRDLSKPIKYFIIGLINRTWSPHFGFYMWDPSDESRAQESINDNSKRDYYVNFILENFERRKINDSTYVINKEKVLHQESEKYGSMDIKFIKNDENHLRTISCRLSSANFDEAIRMAYESIMHFLSLQTFFSANASLVYAMTIEDSKNKAKWTCHPRIRIIAELFIPELIGFTKEFEILLSIYRDAKNNPSPFYRFLCYYKILEAFHAHRYIFKKTDQVIKEKKLSIKRPKRKITKKMLINALLNHRMNEFSNMPYGKYFEYLRSNERLMVAHVFPSDKTKDLVNLNDYEIYSEFVSLGNLTDLVARDILNDEIMLWHQINKHAEKQGKDILNDQ